MCYGIEKADITVEARDMNRVFRIDLLKRFERPGLARIHHNRRNIIFLFMIRNPPENDRVGFAGIVPEMKDHIGQFNIVIRHWRRIGT